MIRPLFSLQGIKKRCKINEKEFDVCLWTGNVRGRRIFEKGEYFYELCGIDRKRYKSTK